MAFWEERKEPSWSLVVLLTLAIAGCGGGSGGSGTAAAASEQSDVASSKQDTRQSATESSDTGQTATRFGAGHKFVAGNNDDTLAQVTQPGQVIQNPIFADPIQVPVPEGEQTDSASGGTGKPRENPADRGLPDVAKPEPERETPGPVADRPTLQWDSPLTRVDGSKLYPGEISGYRVYYRLRHQDDYQSLLLEGPDADSLVLDNFEPGAYEFAVSTIDVKGLESRRSTPVAIDLI